MKSKNRILGAVIALPLALTISACSLGFNKFEKAQETCGVTSGIALSDGGTTLTIDTMGEEDWSGASYSDMNCILDALEVPQYIREEISNTNSLMGRQTAEYEGIKLSWSYHPDRGADMILHYGD